MLTLISLDKIRQLKASGFDITEDEITAVLNSEVKSGDHLVIKHGVELARIAGKSMLEINTLDFANSISSILGIDRRFIGAVGFAVYTLGKAICESNYGGTIVAKDTDFIRLLEHIEEFKAQRELIKKNLYTIIHDKEKGTLSTYGLSRISANRPNNVDVVVDVTALDDMEIIKLRNSMNSHCAMRIRAGKYPTLPRHLLNFSVFEHREEKVVQTFAPLIVPGRITQVYLKTICLRP